jgi:hypothetical protein
MNKPNETYSEFEQEVQSAMFVADADSAYIASLRKQILIRSKPVPRRGFLLRPSWAGLLATLVIVIAALLALGPQRAWAAVRSFFGYIPGVGFVSEDAPLRILSVPVQQEKDGIRVSVEQVVADAQRTTLVYTVEGIRPDQLPATESSLGCPTGDILRLGDSASLGDGTSLAQMGGEGKGWPTGYQAKETFAAVGAKTHAITLVIPCLWGTAPGAAPENWEIPLALVNAPADLKILPVIDLPTPAAQATTSSTPAQASTREGAPGTVANPLGISLTVEKMVELDNGYLFIGNLTWKDGSTDYINFYSMQLELLDVNGNIIPSEVDDASLNSAANANQQRSLPWAIKTNTKALSGPLTLSLPEVIIDKPVQQRFDIDLGASPQLGLKLELNRTLMIEGKAVHILSASLETNRDANYGLTFEIQVDPKEFSAISLSDPDANSPGGGGGGGSGNGLLSQTILYPTQPEGVRHLVINRISYLSKGPWSAQIDLPGSATTVVTPETQPQTCLAARDWQQLKNLPHAPAPTGLQTGVIIQGPVKPGKTFPTLLLFHPDGRPAQEVATGAWEALSPDGNQVIYLDTKGMHITNLSDGKTTDLDWAGENAYHPLWSPDGQRIAFIRGREGILTSRVDGSDLHAVPGTNASSSLAGWLPDSQRLVVTSLGNQGNQVLIIDSSSGQSETSFSYTEPKGGYALVSPDGKSIAFTERRFGFDYDGIFVANLDGSNKHLVASAETLGYRIAAWSQDSLYLFLYAEDPESSLPGQVFLVQPVTCEVIHLENK